MNLELEFGNVLLNSLPLLLFCLLDSFVSLKNSPKIPYQLPFDLSTGVVKVCNLWGIGMQFHPAFGFLSMGRG